MIIPATSGRTSPVRRACDIAVSSKEQNIWTPSVLTGRLCELAAQEGTSWLTLLCRLILNTQESGEPVAWITISEDTFYPPDFSANGVDLSHLPVVFAPDVHRASRAAEHLLRSGAFGLLILHIGAQLLSNATLGRLGSLSDQYSAAVVIVTSTMHAGESPSTLGSLISLRLESRFRTAAAAPEDGFVCELVVTKDKRNGPGRVYTEKCNGLPGMC